jgi:hypothetical protein
MLELDISAYRNTLLKHPAVRQVELVKGVLVITAQTANHWVLVTGNIEPGRLPNFFLSQPRSLIGTLAHVNYQSEICFKDHEGLSVDPEQPAEVLLAALGEVLATLDRSLAAKEKGDLTEFDDELEGYWQAIPGALLAQTHVALDQLTTREIEVYLNRSGTLAFVDRNMTLSYGSLQRVKQDKSLIKGKGLYIPLTGCIVPPSPSQPSSVGQVRAWAQHARDLPSLQRLLKSWPRHASETFILFSQPRLDGSLSAFAVSLKSKRGRHPLLEDVGSWTATAIRVQRHAPGHARARGGANVNLAEKHVAIVGAGSVGGRVAELLGQAGVGKLTPVDPEILESDNPFRNVLGSEFCGAPKVTGLQMNLQRRLPGLQVFPVKESMETWLTSADLDSLDGVVIAIGSPNAERTFNRSQWNHLTPGTPYVATWLEPLGLGGHAQLTRAGQCGCLECLYTDSSGETLLHPKTAYTRPGQRISRNLTGCGGTFTPYSNLDAVQTATLAARLMLAALEGVDTPTYSAWQGSAAAATNAGISTTPWYSNVEPERAAHEYSRVRCPVCGGNK